MSSCFMFRVLTCGSKELRLMFDDVLRPSFELLKQQVESVKKAKMGAVKVSATIFKSWLSRHIIC